MRTNRGKGNGKVNAIVIAMGIGGDPQRKGGRKVVMVNVARVDGYLIAEDERKVGGEDDVNEIGPQQASRDDQKKSPRTSSTVSAA